jgi:hypothetical protein
MDVEVSGSDGYLHASQFNTPQLQVKKRSDKPERNNFNTGV